MNGFNPIQMAQRLKASKNPQQLFQSMVKGNPQVRQIISQIQSGASNMNPRDIAMQLAQQKGIPQDEVERLYIEQFATKPVKR